MKFDPRSGLVSNPEAEPLEEGQAPRKSGRLDQESLTCQFGPLINLSAGGMRIECRKPPSGQVIIQLNGLGEPMQIKARVAWKKRVGLFKWEAGFQFMDMTPEMTRKLTSLATANRVRRSIHR